MWQPATHPPHAHNDRHSGQNTKYAFAIVYLNYCYTDHTQPEWYRKPLKALQFALQIERHIAKQHQQALLILLAYLLLGNRKQNADRYQALKAIVHLNQYP